MRDYWLTKELLQAVGIGFGLLAVVGIGLALWLPQRWWGKLLAVVAVGFVISMPLRKAVQESQQQQVAVNDYQVRYAKAKALFDERCKTAGDKIYKTGENVDGVLLMKPRPKEINLDDQYRLDDPFGSDCHGEECIAELLRVTDGGERNSDLANRLRDGFSFVDFVDPVDGQRHRYKGSIEPSTSHRLSLQRTVPDSPTPTFGITWDDISSREDRDYWIAGGVLKVLDLKTGEVIGERRGYMMDRGQGSKDGGRSPWGFAYDNACPKLPTVSDGRAIRVGHTRKFVLSVLKSREGK